jgi:hypothetical protein
MTKFSAKLFFIYALMFSFCLHTWAQKYSQKDRGLVIYKLGTDTTISQFFEFSNKQFHTIILSLTGQATKYEGDGRLDETGDLKQVLSKTFNLDSSGNWVMNNEASNIFTGDSSIYTVKRYGKEVFRRSVPGKGIVSTAADATSFFVFPYMGFFAPSKIGDTLFHCQLSFGECRKFHVARLAKHQLKVGSNVMGILKLFVDDNGRMQGADAIGSSLNWIATVERENNKDYGEWLDILAKRKWATGSLAPRTFRDTARLVTGNKNIEVDYWRPYRRNREIFGAVVPWNRIWRTGANNATQFRTTADLNFNGNKLPAGKYSIWTYPTETGWQLIFNKKADVWGTEYDSTANFLKLSLKVEKTSEPVEILKISLLPQDENKTRLIIEWEYYKAWAEFETGK